jgi:beta-aspartyl-peptidase (threonine type)
MLVLCNNEGRLGLEKSRDLLQTGACGLDAIQAGIEVAEADASIRTAGFGGAPNMLGEVQCDAAVMDGSTRQIGAVGAVRSCLHVFALARRVMQELPHTFLVGEGAERWAREQGFPQVEMLSPEAAADYQKWRTQHFSAGQDLQDPALKLGPLAWPEQDWTTKTRDTIIYLAKDRQGKLVGGTSSSGWDYKYPGRLGDSPLIGAGLYVDQRYGGCSCTHTGEMSTRSGTARLVVAALRYGASVKDACYEAVSDLATLRGGYRGPVMIHALDAKDNAYAVFARISGKEVPPPYWLWRAAENSISELQAEVVDLPA